MIKTFKYGLFISFFILNFSLHSQKHYNFKLSNVSYNTEDTKVAIKFDLNNYKNHDRFNISILATDDNLKTYNIKSFTNNFNLSGGKTQIIYWDPLKDGYKLDGNYKFDLKLTKSSTIKIPYNKHLLLSAILPGIGDYKIRNGWWHAIYTGLFYGTIYYTLDFNKKANRNYSSYKNSFDIEKSNNYFLEAKKQANLSRLLFGTALATWSIDMYALQNRIKKVKANTAKSRFYQNKEDRMFLKSFRMYKYLNTKEKYEQYYDSALVAYNNNNYGLSKAYFNTSKLYGIKDSIISIKTEQYLINAKNEIDFNLYYKSGLDKINNFDFSSAEENLKKALDLKPNRKDLKIKLDLISQYNNNLYNGNHFFKNNDFDSALVHFKLSSKLFETDSVSKMIILTKQEIKFLSFLISGDSLMLKKDYEAAKEFYLKAKSIKPNNKLLKSKIYEVFQIINKIKNENQLFNTYYKNALLAIKEEDYANALVNFNSAIKFKPFDTKVSDNINKLNKFNKFLTNGNEELNNNNFNSALYFYNQAQSIYNSTLVIRKIDEANNEILRNQYLGKGDQLVKDKNFDQAIIEYNKATQIRRSVLLDSKIQKAICSNIIKVANSFFDAKEWKKALAKYEEANGLCPSNNILYKIKIVNQKLRGKEVVDNQWITIYNKNGGLIELKFRISKNSCMTINGARATKFFYRYSGEFDNVVKYIHWKLEYTECSGDKYILTHGVPIGKKLVSDLLGMYPPEQAYHKDVTKYQFTNKSISSIPLPMYLFDIKENSQKGYFKSSPK